MKKSAKISALLLAIILLSGLSIFTNVAKASNDTSEKEVNVVSSETTEESTEAPSTGDKALASGIAIGLAGLGCGLGMGIAISKAADGISRQPEAESKIRSTLMIGIVFIETVVIYALVVSILVIFVL